MAIISLIIWYVSVVIALSVLFSLPQIMFRMLRKHRSPNDSKPLNKIDQDFVERHVQILEAQQLKISKLKRPFILGPWGFLLAFFAMMIFLLMIFFTTPMFSDWLIQSFVLNSTTPKSLVVPYPSTLTFAMGLFLGLITLVPALQFFVVRKDMKKSSIYILMPSGMTKANTEEFTTAKEEIRKKLPNQISELIQGDFINSYESYTAGDLVQALVKRNSDILNRLAWASFALIFLGYIMSALDFVKVTEREIIYSPPYSFEIIRKPLDSIDSATYLCEKDGASRYLKLKITLDDAFEFKVRSLEFDSLETPLQSSNIALKDIDSANEWCQNLE